MHHNTPGIQISLYGLHYRMPQKLQPHGFWSPSLSLLLSKTPTNTHTCANKYTDIDIDISLPTMNRIEEIGLAAEGREAEEAIVQAATLMRKAVSCALASVAERGPNRGMFGNMQNAKARPLYGYVLLVNLVKYIHPLCGCCLLLLLTTECPPISRSHLREYVASGRCNQIQLLIVWILARPCSKACDLLTWRT